MAANIPAPEPDAPVPQGLALRKQNYRKRLKAKKMRNVAVLDMETDPFDNKRPNDLILPFLAVLYSDEFETIVIWEQDHEIFINRLVAAILGLPDAFTIYAHNGGKFDFMFLVSRLRGSVSFKGRGIMRANIGRHEIRDSYHIIPERLAAYKKDGFDYSTLTKARREKFKDTIIEYCVNDCRYLLDLVKKFIMKYGFKISVGAAAIATLQGAGYKVDKVAPSTDEGLRRFFFGGRVECIAGAGYFQGPLKLYDVNSMYPFVMATMRHPIGSEYVYRPGKPNASTVFLKLKCENNGALLARNEAGELTTRIPQGEFFTSKWEYETALELGLIRKVEILECVDNFRRSNFAKFVEPLYAERAAEKELLKTLPKGSAEYDRCKAAVLFLKLILNNAYGKFAQNPRRYREHYLTDPGEVPPDDEHGGYDKPPEFMGAEYWIWSRAAPTMRFNNVGTSASITGGARAVLMRAIHSAKNPIYCDTDSLICEELRDHNLHAIELGAWDLEKQISELIVCGKKLYAYKDLTGEETIKSKGTAGLTWNDMLALLNGENRLISNVGPTLTRTGNQSYITRTIRRTTPVRLVA